MDNPDHQEKAEREDQIINILMPSLINHSFNVKSINGMIDILETTIVQLLGMIEELKPKDDSDEKTSEVDLSVHRQISNMTDILKKMKETFEWQDESLQITYENMLKQLEKCFSKLGVKLNLDEQQRKFQNPHSEENHGDNDTKKEKSNLTPDVDDIHTCTNKIRQMEEEAKYDKEFIQALTAANAKLNNDLQEEAKNAMKTIQDLQDANTKHKNYIQHLHAELDHPNSRRLKSHKKLTTSVQVLYQRKGGNIVPVQKEITSILASYFHSVSFERCEHTDEIDPHKILLVLCINSSRLETEAKNAVEGIKNPENTLLLIFHHKNIHALTRQENSGQHLADLCFKELGGIFDFAFQSEKGIHECKMNKNSTSAVVSFIRLHTGMK